MFQFTTTNVINSLKDSSGQDLVVGKDGKLQVKRVNTFKKENIAALYVAPAEREVLGQAILDLSTLENPAKGDVYRLNLVIGLSQASQVSYYANDFYTKSKPFSFDFVFGASAADTVAKLVKDINKFNFATYGEKMFTVEQGKTGSNPNGQLIIKAMDEFQIFKVVNIEKFNDKAYHGMGEYVKAISATVDGTDNTITPGKEGFGTYSYILRNLRLPTFARTTAFALNQEESPVPGALYNQYTIHYNVDRGVLGTNAVGDLVRSVTTHVFFVEQSLANKFEAEIVKAFGIQPTALAPGDKAYASAMSAPTLESLQWEILTLKSKV